MEKSPKDLYIGVYARGGAVHGRPVESRLHTSPVNWAFPTRESESDTRDWLAWIVLLPNKHHTLLYSVCLYINPGSPAR